jgi:hypothetical protein
MRQRRYAKTGELEDDQLPRLTAPLQELGTDVLIISKSAKVGDRGSQSGNIVIHTTRDHYSGMPYAVPLKNRSEDECYQNLKDFAGAAGARRPNLIVKSDAAGEITNAIVKLGWISDPSLENRWPHNTKHERWGGTYKCVLRSGVLQSGFPVDAWDLGVSYAAVALSAVQKAPILPWEKGPNGEPLPEFRDKALQTCWEAHHNGETFPGVVQPFGRLCYYLQASIL